MKTGLSSPQAAMPKHAELCTFAASVHARAVEKGWYETPRAWDELVFLVQGELHEAAECLRAGYAVEQCWAKNDESVLVLANDGAFMALTDDVLIDYSPKMHGKPEGFLVEVADACIRALDALTYRGSLPLIVPAPHPSEIARITNTTARQLVIRHALAIGRESAPRDLSDLVRECLEWAHVHHYPLWEVMKLKHEYNGTRAHKHGKTF